MDKLSYLHYMEIPVWRSRQTETTLAAWTCALIKDAHKKLVAILIAEDRGVSQEHQLLEKIARSLSSHCEIIFATHEATVAPYFVDCTVVLFGKLLLQQSAPKMIQTHALTEMIQNPSSKKMVWEQIKFLVQ